MNDYQDDFQEENLPIVADEGLAQTPRNLAQEWGLDIEEQAKLLEKAVKFGARMIQMRNQLIRMFTYSEDWSVFGSDDKAKACISAAGVLRIVDKANFPIRYHDVKSKKEMITDEDGKVIGYRYIFEGYATLQSRSVHAIGQYSTREAFLGKRGGEWRNYREINESHIRQAAHTYFKGNAAKDLLGLKGIPVAEYEQLTIGAGQDVNRTTSVQHGSGTQGGIGKGDRDRQNELQQILVELASQGLVVRHEQEYGKDIHFIAEPSQELVKYIDDDGGDEVDLCVKSSIKALTTWTNKEGKMIRGHAEIGRVKNKQLEVLLRKTRELKEKGGY